MIVSRTPYRISLLGGGTDYPAFFHRTAGSVLSFSIDKYCHILARRIPPFFPYKNVVSYSNREYTNSIEEISHPAVREILKYYSQPEGWEIIHSGDLPARSGMGSSSSFVVGFTNIMYNLTPDGEYSNFPIGDGVLKKSWH
jgi:D-glycero-alpha-D-manno-heptose-7-phosphate kinase